MKKKRFSYRTLPNVIKSDFFKVFWLPALFCICEPAPAKLAACKPELISVTVLIELSAPMPPCWFSCELGREASWCATDANESGWSSECPSVGKSYGTIYGSTWSRYGVIGGLDKKLQM